MRETWVIKKNSKKNKEIIFKWSGKKIEYLMLDALNWDVKRDKIINLLKSFIRMLGIWSQLQILIRIFRYSHFFF